MDLKRLRTFVTVADRGTVSGAAQALRITQPALSRQLQDLREEFGVPLFEQVGRRLQLTTEGADLLPTCRSLLTQADTVRFWNMPGHSRAASAESSAWGHPPM
jgi:DNA-binding transcriptional LysR family regulator